MGRQKVVELFDEPVREHERADVIAGVPELVGLPEHLHGLDRLEMNEVAVLHQGILSIV